MWSEAESEGSRNEKQLRSAHREEVFELHIETVIWEWKERGEIKKNANWALNRACWKAFIVDKAGKVNIAQFSILRLKRIMGRKMAGRLC